jgi:putative phosphoribosyl transferase
MENLSHDKVERIPVDGIHIEGRLRLPENAQGLVLFAHGSGSSRHSPRNNYVAEVLHGRALGTLLMDLLTPEEDSDYTQRFDIELLADRLVKATHWVRKQSVTGEPALGYFGASTGAAAALDVAFLEGDSISAVISRGGRPDLASLAALQGVRAPTLFIVGGLDTEVLELNEHAYRKLTCEKDFAIVPNATHLFEEPGTLERAAGHAADWFERYLKHRVRT